MSGNAARYLTVLLLATTPLLTVEAATEIYKWVDANGNIHFGDKPNDPAQRAKAKPVELKTNYQPPPRTAEEQHALEREQRAIQQKSKEYERTQQQKRDEERTKLRREKVERCTAYESDIKKLTGRELVNGRSRGYYVKTEDGKSVTSKRQAEIVEELRAEMVAMGCA